MLLIKRDHLTISNRQRKEITRDEKLRNLRDSIAKSGLLHPIVVAQGEGDNYILVAGGRRVAAIEWLWELKGELKHAKESVPEGMLPITFFINEELQREYAELGENEDRLDLPWQDRNAAYMRIHHLEQKFNPKQSISATAAKVAEATNKTFSAAQTAITRAKAINKHINDPNIRYARNEREAYNLAVRKDEAEIKAILAKQSSLLPPNIKLIEGDSYVELPKLPPSTIDLIISDPPYGISAGDAGFRSRTVHHHNYEDTPDAARNFIRLVLLEGFRITRNRSNVFIFCDIDLWPYITTQAEAAGWTPFRTPIIWCKSETEGLAPWGSQGFRRTYELIFYATKGQRGLVKSPVDILRHSRVGRAERDYAAAKPVGLLKELIDAATLPGESILDPCCGSGASIVAAKELKRSAIGIEKDRNAYNLAMAKLSEGATHEPDSAETDLTSL